MLTLRKKVKIFDDNDLATKSLLLQNCPWSIVGKIDPNNETDRVKLDVIEKF